MRHRIVSLILFMTAASLLACGGTDDPTSDGAAGRSTTTTNGTSGTGGTGGATTGSGGQGGVGGSSTGSGASSGAAGTTSGGAGSAGASTGGSGGGAVDGGKNDGSTVDGRITDAPRVDVSDAGVRIDAPVVDTGIPIDAPKIDVSTDGGLSPYKGVANSPCGEMTTMGATWFYNWGLGRGSCATPDFIPMLWGHTGNEQTPTGISNAMNTLVSQGYKTVLGFNEPDNSGQSNMSVATAISLWPSFNNPGLRIGSPATSANAAGQTWFKDFMAQVNADTTGTLRVDFIAAHWYGWNAGSCEPNASSLESYIKTIEAIPGNRPIWLTEWGCMNQSNPDEATVVAFFKGAVAMFAKHPRIERYAWYPWDPYNELFLDGGITGMGTAFAAAPQYK